MSVRAYDVQASSTAVSVCELPERASVRADLRASVCAWRDERSRPDEQMSMLAAKYANVQAKWTSGRACEWTSVPCKWTSGRANVRKRTTGRPDEQSSVSMRASE